MAARLTLHTGKIFKRIVILSLVILLVGTVIAALYRRPIEADGVLLYHGEAREARLVLKVRNLDRIYPHRFSGSLELYAEDESVLDIPLRRVPVFFHPGETSWSSFPIYIPEVNQFEPTILYFDESFQDFVFSVTDTCLFYSSDDFYEQAARISSGSLPSLSEVKPE
ncbi:MAG: hypothetical protein PUC47_01155 [Oscillospiraceae bacterium]|nr:hypothetical protein [Oscillospiraceae bacterium]